MSRRAQPREDVRPDLGHPDELLQATMGMLLDKLTGDDSFMPASCEGCMETQWRGLPAQDLFLAAHEGRVNDLQVLLTKPENRKRVHDFDNDKVGILHVYALGGNDDNAEGIIDTLVEAGIDVNLRSQSTQETPLQYAVIYSRVKVVEALLKHGARVDLTDWKGDSPGPTARKKCQHNGNGDENCCQVLKMIQKAQNEQNKDTTLQNKAEDLRQRGNACFSKDQLEEARDWYTKSLQVLEDPRAYSNRALCALNLGKQLLSEQRPNCYKRTIADWGREALSDAGRAINMDPSFTKAHYRYILGQAMARDFPRAKKGARRGLEACPDNEALLEIMSIFNMWQVPDGISNPLSDHAYQSNARVQAGEPWYACSFCRCKMPLPLEEQCPFCGMGTETDVTEDEIVAFIMNH